MFILSSDGPSKVHSPEVGESFENKNNSLFTKVNQYQILTARNRYHTYTHFKILTKELKKLTKEVKFLSKKILILTKIQKNTQFMTPQSGRQSLKQKAPEGMYL